MTYGATAVDGNGGSDAALTYAAGSAGAAAPLHGWNFASPTIRYAGPTGLALDAAGNFYVNGALHTSLGPSYGLFVASLRTSAIRRRRRRARFRGIPPPS